METVRQQFLAPQDEFSPAPFWFWNDELDRDELKRQLLDFYGKGIRSIVIHPRKGLPLTTPYMSEAFLDYVEYIVKEAETLGMTVILYDEAMYPSGSCNGQVVKENPTFAAKGLKIWNYEPEAGDPVFGEGNWFIAAVLEESDGQGHLCRRGFADFDDFASAYREAKNPGQAWYFTLIYSLGTIRGVHPGEDDEEPGAPKAADLLDIEATKTFLRLTHDVYYRRLKPYFGTTITAIFTDEPSIMGRNHLPGLIPWGRTMLDRYVEQGGAITDLVELFEKEKRASGEAYVRYRKIIHDLMAEQYFQPISDWCEAHGIALCGHPASSEDIGYLKYFQLPCQDIVWRYIDPDEKNGLIGGHSTMGKCSSDAARHSGKRRNGNECFGACGHKDDPWDFPFTDMMWYLNWLFIRGVNLIIPHAFYYSLRDERVNERPPDVGPNSPWWKDYETISTYIRRMCWVNTDSRNVTELAVLCEEAHLPWKPVKALFENQIEFNYLEQSLLKECKLEAGVLRIEQQAYRAVLVEAGMVLAEEEQAVLDRFREEGGTVLFVEEYLDEGLVETLRRFDPQAIRVAEWQKDLRSSHVVKDGVHFYLLANEGEEELCFDAEAGVDGTGELWDPWTGTVTALCEKTIHLTIRPYQALLLAYT